MDLALTKTQALTMAGGSVGPVEDAAIGIDDGELLNQDVTALSRRVTERAGTVFENAAEDWRAAGSALVDDVDSGRL